MSWKPRQRLHLYLSLLFLTLLLFWVFGDPPPAPSHTLSLFLTYRCLVLAWFVASQLFLSSFSLWAFSFSYVCNLISFFLHGWLCSWVAAPPRPPLLFLHTWPHTGHARIHNNKRLIKTSDRWIEYLTLVGSLFFFFVCLFVACFETGLASNYLCIWGWRLISDSPASICWARGLFFLLSFSFSPLPLL